MKRIIALVLALCFLVALVPAALADTRTDARVAADKAVAHYKAGKTLSSWWDVLAVTAAGENPKTGFALPEVPTPEKTASACATTILHLLARGENPRAYFPGLDLVTTLSGLQNADGSFGALSVHVYAVLAMEICAPQGYRRQAAINWLGSQQCADGGFTYSGSMGDVDMTGMALLALGRLGQEKSDAVTRAVAFLKKQATAAGGFIPFWSDKENSCSAAAAVWGLTAVGQTEAAAPMVKNLLSFQMASGAFCYEAGGGEDGFSTQQALLALADAAAGSSVFSRLTFGGERYVLSPLAQAFGDSANVSPWAVEYVYKVYTLGLFQGANGKFNPLKPISRSEVAAVLQRVDGTRPATEKPVSDLPEGRWDTAAVRYAVGAGLLDAPGGLFRPETPATREEVAVAIARLFSLDTARAMEKYQRGDFQILDMNKAKAENRPAVAALYAEGIMVGSGGYLRPGEAITRQEIAKVFALLFE